jgi:predicted DNA-binding transcriptional regulator AlpA
MSTKRRFPIPSQESVEPKSDFARPLPLMMPAWHPDGPTLLLKGLLKVTRVSRSKAYELMKSDPDFPKGIPLYDSDRSPRFYWTHEALAWIESRATKFNNQKSI